MDASQADREAKPMKEYERLISLGKVSPDFFREEIRNDFLVSSTRKKIWAIEIDMFQELERVCKKHSLRYFMFWGSILGAIRHRGFIPWDDDMDIILPRDDYETLFRLSDEFEYPYYLQTPYNDPGFYYAHARLRNTNTTCITEQFKYQPFNHGIFIDILPLDNFLPNAEDAFVQMQRLEYDNSTLMRASNPNLSEKDQIRVQNCPKESPLDVFERTQRLATQFNGLDTEFVCATTATTYGFKRDLFFKEDFKSAVEVEYEYSAFPVPVGWERILEIMYGPKWREFPPLEQRGDWHGTNHFDPDRPYQDVLPEIRG